MDVQYCMDVQVRVYIKAAGDTPPSEGRATLILYASLKKKLPIFINIAEGKT
jgi:uncharacterized protein YggU (UPF0235/DUF167 family)